MTITAVINDEAYVFGYVEYDASYFRLNQSTSIYPLVSINQDLNSLSPIPDNPIKVWLTRWYLNLYTFGIIGNTPLLKSALPSYYLGEVCMVYKGQCSALRFWNYTSQRFDSCVCWNIPDEVIFPTAYIPPSLVTNATLLALDYETHNPLFMYANSFAIKPTHADIESMRAIVYYQAEYFSYQRNLSIGDI